MNILPVIMAGGAGSRLWPMSRANYPKQFLSLVNDSSMLQDTITRLNGLDHLPVSIICNEAHRFLVAEQLRSINLPHSGIILEPFGRNTAPAVALSAFQAVERGQDPLLLVLAADHLIEQDGTFREAIESARHLAEKGKLVTFGIVPSRAETGYGYIRKGSSVESTQAYIVDAFVEKPELSVAEQYFADGNYYWNSGMFMFKASRYLEELKLHRPDILDAAKNAYSGAHTDLDFIRLDERAFSQCPNESIDYAVMEKTVDAVVYPLDVGWSDVGAWSSLWEISEQDNYKNVLKGDVLTDSTSRCYVSSQHRLVATVGIEDLIIIDTKDALLVAGRNRVQDVKNIVSDLKDQGRRELQYHREVYRPWGMYDHIADGERYHVKKVVVKPGGKTATQLHYHRAEHWVVVSGTAVVYRGSEKHVIGENKSIYIPVGTEHCFENPGKVPLEIIEVRTGSYLSEDDIVRTHSQDEDY